MTDRDPTAPAITDVDEVLTTTRAVRLRLDLERPVERETILRCIDIAVQAPMASNKESWRFVVVMDAEQRRRIAEVFQHNWDTYVVGAMKAGDEASLTRLDPTRRGSDEAARRQTKVMESAEHLIHHMADVPVHIVICSATRPPDEPTGAVASGFYGSIFPAVWSLQLALRSRGLGSTLTCGYLRTADRVAEILDLPKHFTQVALLPVAYTKGLDFKPSRRRPLDEVVRFDRWGS